MSKRYALCVLSLMRDNSLPYLYTFDGRDVDSGWGNGKGRYEGIQTNVGPIECLMDHSRPNSDSAPKISKIIYLCSAECLEIPIKNIEGSPNEGVTTEGYFRDVVYDYYLRHLPEGSSPIYKDELFMRLPYEPSNPAESLQLVLDAIGEGDVIVDVDTTGGLRDAVNLLTLAIEVLQRQSREGEGLRAHPRLGTTVYAQSISSPDWKSKAPGTGNISLQNRTYALGELVSAVEAFVSYGKAGKIGRFFNDGVDYGDRVCNSPMVDTEMMTLCKDLCSFSDSLSICRIDGLLYLARQIHKDLDAAEAATKRRIREHHTLKTFLSRIDDLPEQKNGKVSRKDTKFRGTRARLVGKEGGVQDNEVKDHLRSLGLGDDSINRIMRTRNIKALHQEVKLLHKRSGVSHEELLFCALIPSIRRDFVGGELGRTMPETQLLAETILWCVRREMLQQALALYKEQVPMYLEPLGYVSWADESGNRDERRKARVSRLVDLSQRGLDTGTLTSDSNLKLTQEGISNMPAIVYWYRTLNSLRNEIMHQNEEDKRTSRDLAESLLRQNYIIPSEIAEHIGCHFDKDGRLRSLAHDIESGVLALEGRMPLKSRF